MSSLSSVETLIIKRVFTSPIEEVFEAWTNPEVISNWFGPETFKVHSSNICLEEGGQYEIEIVSPEGNHIKHFGTYVEISTPTKLVFTWVLEDQSCEGSEGQLADTLVSIDFKSLGQSTEMMLSHEKLPSKKAYDGHQFGWTSSFNSLATLIN